MKSLFFALLIVIPLSLVRGQDAKESDMEFNATMHDFGTLKKNAKAECVFTVSNKGKIPLIITSVKASCGCTVPSYPKSPILPGNAGEITIKYNTSALGLFNKGINVFTNFKNEAVVLTIKGEVIK